MLNNSGKMSSPRKLATIKGVASPKSPKVIAVSEVKKLSGELTPRSVYQPNPNLTFAKTTSSITSSVKRLAKTKVTDKQVEVMELPARLETGANKSIISLKSASSGDRVRNAGGGGDSCMRLPLECISKSEIKNEIKEGRLSFHYLDYYDDDDEQQYEEEPEEEFDEEKMTTILGPDRARFNVWKGINYDLHLLGDFKSDFEQRVKSFQRPETKPISMDPFCRLESGLKDEPCDGEAFLVWKSNNSDQWRQEEWSSSNVTIAPLISSEEEDIIDSDTDSLPDPEMKEYMCKQKQKVKKGLNPSGETLYYDEDFGVVRNLHRESHSLTNYGVMPDDTWMGKANIFYPEMSASEKQMLKAVASKDQVTSKISKAPQR